MQSQSSVAAVAAMSAAVALVAFGCGGSDPTPAPTPSSPAAPTPAENQCAFGGVMDDVTYYEGFAKQFVGLNPRKGFGSGFFFPKVTWNAVTYGTAPVTNGVAPGQTPRTDLCTCDCKASAGGLGCVGYGGIAFRYISMLASPGKDCIGDWSGQMAAQDCGAAGGGRCNTTDPDQTYFQFMGTDKRESPGGSVVYDVATTLALTDGGIGGVFRQPNDPTSCKAGLKDKADFMAELKKEQDSCYFKCGDNGEYSKWLEYCAADTDKSEELGFRGWEKQTQGKLV